MQAGSAKRDSKWTARNKRKTAGLAKGKRTASVVTSSVLKPAAAEKMVSLNDDPHPLDDASVEEDSEGPLEVLPPPQDFLVDHVLGYLVGRFIGRFPGWQAVRNMADSWRVPYRIQVHKNQWILFKFDNVQMRDRVLKGGPYAIYGCPLYLKIMPPCFLFKDEEQSKIPIWMQIYGLPLDLWSIKALNKIASYLGKPLYRDQLTKTRGRINYARVLVEVDISKELPSQIPVTLPTGKDVALQLHFECSMCYCSECRHLGQHKESCNQASKTMQWPDKESGTGGEASRNLRGRSRMQGTSWIASRSKEAAGQDRKENKQPSGAPIGQDKQGSKTEGVGKSDGNRHVQTDGTSVRSGKARAASIVIPQRVTQHSNINKTMATASAVAAARKVGSSASKGNLKGISAMPEAATCETSNPTAGAITTPAVKQSPGASRMAIGSKGVGTVLEQVTAATHKTTISVEFKGKLSLSEGETCDLGMLATVTGTQVGTRAQLKKGMQNAKQGGTVGKEAQGPLLP